MVKLFDFEYHVKIWFEYDRFGFKLSRPPLGSLLGKLVIWGQFGNDQNVSLELISVHQTIKGDPNDGLDKLKPNRSYVNHIPTWY